MVKLSLSSAPKRSWGGSAVLGRQRGLGGFPHERLPWFPPLALCRGFPHERLHRSPTETLREQTMTSEIKNLTNYHWLTYD